MKKRLLILLLLAFLLNWWLQQPKAKVEVPAESTEPSQTGGQTSSPTPAPGSQSREPSPFPQPTNIPLSTAIAVASPSPLPVNSRRPEPEETSPLWLLIQRNQLCRYIKLNPEVPDLARALLKVTGARPNPDVDVILGELFASQGPLSGKTGGEVFMQSEPTRFYTALLAAGLLSGRELPRPNPELATSLFYSLEQANPVNAAYPFFHAAFLQSKKESPHDVQMALFRALQAAEFEIYLDEIQERFVERGMINPTAWLAAKTITSRLPSPNFSIPKSLIIAEANRDPRERGLIEKFGRLLVKKYKTDVEKHRTLLPHRFEYEAGQSILAGIHATNDLTKTTVNGPLSGSFEQEYDEAYQKLKSKEFCDTRLFDRAFGKYKSNYVH